MTIPNETTNNIFSSSPSLRRVSSIKEILFSFSLSLSISFKTVNWGIGPNPYPKSQSNTKSPIEQ